MCPSCWLSGCYCRGGDWLRFAAEQRWTNAAGCLQQELPSICPGCVKITDVQDQFHAISCFNGARSSFSPALKNILLTMQPDMWHHHVCTWCLTAIISQPMTLWLQSHAIPAGLVLGTAYVFNIALSWMNQRELAWWHPCFPGRCPVACWLWMLRLHDGS